MKTFAPEINCNSNGNCFSFCHRILTEIDEVEVEEDSPRNIPRLNILEDSERTISYLSEKEDNLQLLLLYDNDGNDNNDNKQIWNLSPVMEKNELNSDIIINTASDLSSLPEDDRKNESYSFSDDKTNLSGAYPTYSVREKQTDCLIEDDNDNNNQKKKINNSSVSFDKNVKFDDDFETDCCERGDTWDENLSPHDFHVARTLTPENSSKNYYYYYLNNNMENCLNDDDVNSEINENTFSMGEK